jgi:hypothetical protein
MPINQRSPPIQEGTIKPFVKMLKAVPDILDSKKRRVFSDLENFAELGTALLGCRVTNAVRVFWNALDADGLQDSANYDRCEECAL